MRTRQQRAEKLLQLMDADLEMQLGRQTLKTGDYTWKDSLLPQLKRAIEIMVDKWVIDLPPYGYDTKNPADMALWSTRRQAGLIWVKSPDSLAFCKYVQDVLTNFF